MSEKFYYLKASLCSPFSLQSSSSSCQRLLVCLSLKMEAYHVLFIWSLTLVASGQIMIGNPFPFGGFSSGPSHHRQANLRGTDNTPPIQVFEERPPIPNPNPNPLGMFAQRLPPQNTFATPEQPQVTISGPGPLPSLEQTIALLIRPFAGVLQG